MVGCLIAYKQLYDIAVSNGEVAEGYNTVYGETYEAHRSSLLTLLMGMLCCVAVLCCCESVLVYYCNNALVYYCNNALMYITMLKDSST